MTTPSACLVAGSALLALLLGGCGLTADCADVGAVSGVSFQFNDVLDAHRGEPLLVEACVQDDCTSLRVDRRHQQQEIALGADLVSDDSPVPVSLTISQPDGKVVYAGQATANPEKVQPNGPSCPPTAWSAQVAASGEHDLRQVGPASD